MNEITCPRCKVLQKLSRNKLCSYCFFNLNNEIDKLNQTNPNLSVDYNSLDDQAIVDILKIDQIKPALDKLSFLVFLGLIFIVSVTVFFLDKKIFFIKESGFNFIEKFSIFFSLITTYLSYKYFSKNYDINQSIDAIVSTSYRGREITGFEKKFQFLFLLLFLNFSIIYLNINALNDMSSIIFPARKFDVFIHQKESKVVKRKHTYYIHVTNWKRNNDETIRLIIPENQWQSIKQDQAAKIKIKRGLLNDVIWSLKQ